MAVITTLNFFGRTEEALDFYRNALGAEVQFLMRFRDSPDPTHPPEMDNMIFHATFRVEDTMLMASDVGFDGSESNPTFVGFALLLRLNSIDRAKQVFARLADGGEVIVPLAESSFTTLYGVVNDRFGISWKINVDQELDS